MGIGVSGSEVSILRNEMEVQGMSSQALQQFCDSVATDFALQESVRGVADREHFMNRVVCLGAERGYSFTVSDVRAAIQGKEPPTWDLSNDQLLEIAGGRASLWISATEGNTCMGTCTTGCCATGDCVW